MKGYIHPYVYCSIIYHNQIMEVARVSTDRWMDKEEVIYLYTIEYILFSHKKKNEILPFAMTWMELKSIILREISQSEKDKYPMISLMKFKKQNKWTKEEGRETNRETDLVFKKCLFIFETERDCEGGRRGRERGRQRIPSRLCAVSAEPNVGLEFTSHEIMTWAKTKSETLNQLSHPGTPRNRPLTIGNKQMVTRWEVGGEMSEIGDED